MTHNSTDSLRTASPSFPLFPCPFFLRGDDTEYADDSAFARYMYEITISSDCQLFTRTVNFVAHDSGRLGSICWAGSCTAIDLEIRHTPGV